MQWSWSSQRCVFARIEHNVRLLDIPRQHAEHAFELAFWRGFCKIVTRLFNGTKPRPRSSVG
ncbi:hypothetical protein HMPREF1578_01337 [Gardnerella pickettii JCP8017B]|nr:hypothetical protein HMPREF1578_01337 [Gardnerella pickettii JCP8017B]